MNAAEVLAEAVALKHLKTGASRLSNSSYSKVTDAGAAVHALTVLSGEIGSKYHAKCDRKFQTELVDVIFAAGRDGWVAIGSDGKLLHMTGNYAATALVVDTDFNDVMVRAFQLGLPVNKLLDLLDKAIQNAEGAAKIWSLLRTIIIDGMDVIETHR